jgi:hypothetical protein
MRPAALLTHERKIVSSRCEEPHNVASLDRLRPPLQPLDLSVGEKPVGIERDQ